MAFCLKLRIKLRSLLKQFDSYVEKNVDTAIAVTTALKSFLESPVAQILTAVIPSNIDEVVRVRLIYGLSVAIDGLNIVDACKDQDKLEDKLQCFLAQVKKVNPALQDALFHKLAAIIARELDNGSKAQHIYDLFVQAKYSSTK